MPPGLLGIAWHRDRRRTPAARAFVELARQVAVGYDLAAVAA